MRCGVLCDQHGNVKRTWALISDTITVPVEHEDHIIEWEVDHGEHLPHTQERLAKTQAAVEEQDRIVALQTHDDVLVHGKTYRHDMAAQQVTIAAPSSEPVYYGAGKGLHYRRVDAESNLQERAAHPSNTLTPITPGKTDHH